MGLRFLLRISRYLAVFTLLMVFLPLESASARTWNVLVDGSGDAPTVQAGIDSAALNDTVLVFPGTYNEVIDFRGKDIVVRGSGMASSSILDGSGFTGVAVVTFQSGETRHAKIENLTITHGERGVFIHEAAPTVLGNIISDNGWPRASLDGAGIWCSAYSNLGPWSPLIQSNTITNNTAGNLGGGIGTWRRMVPEILDNFIVLNEAMDGDGGGIYYRSGHNGALMRGNLIQGNRSGDHGGGIYVALIGTPPSPPPIEVEIAWNTIVDNSAQGSPVTGDSGGGILIIETDAWVHHNTIVGNKGGAAPTTLGGGIAVERVGSPVIERNVLAFTVQGGGIFCLNGATPLIRNNMAWQNAGGDALGECSTWWQSDGNVVDNPYFCDMGGGDYRVASNSGVMTHPAGPLGAFPDPGCGPVAVHPSTWGAIKARYSSHQ